MRRIVFVDDEQHVLNGLRRALSDMRDDWHMDFFTDAREALKSMCETPVDVAVSDMMMPQMDGADFLAEVKRLYPETVRIIFSGHAEQENLLKAVGSTHQFLTKPCDPQTLQEAIARTDSLQAILGNQSLSGLITQMDSLPTLPRLYLEIVEALQSPKTSLPAIGSIIEKDLGMSTKILQIVNSAYFGLGRPITNVERAVTHLGLEMVNSLVLTIDVFSQYSGPKMPEFCAESLWDHSMRTGAMTRLVVDEEHLDKQVADDAFMAGTLHDAGKVVLASNKPEQYREILRRARDEKLPLSVVERDSLGTTHAEVGAYLFRLWGLPDTVIEAIAYHAMPRERPGWHFDALSVVHVANGLVREHEFGQDGESGPYIDEQYLQLVGIEERLPIWRERCRDRAEEAVSD